MASPHNKRRSRGRGLSTGASGATKASGGSSAAARDIEYLSENRDLVQRYLATAEGEVASLGARFPKLDEGRVAAIVISKLLERIVRILGDCRRPIEHVFREFRHTPQDRRTLEAALKLIRQSRFMVPQDQEKALTKLREVSAVATGAIGIAIKSLEAGDVCEKNECAVAGCFRVVNTGGFDKKVMDLSEREAATAARLVAEKGFAQVCYGDVYVTQRISKDNVLAFYSYGEDRMYVRAHAKKGEAALVVDTFIHELGHRLDGRFFKPEGHQELKKVFAQWTRRKAASPRTSTFDPKPGVRFSDPKRPDTVYEIEGVAYVGRGNTPSVIMHVVDDPQKTHLRITLEALKRSLGGKLEDDPFPSVYAATEARELFAELFMVYVLGTATQEQAETFERILAAGGITPSRAGAAFGSSPRRIPLRRTQH